MPNVDLNPYQSPHVGSHVVSCNDADRSTWLTGILLLFEFRGRIPRGIWWTLLPVIWISSVMTTGLMLSLITGKLADAVVLSLQVPIHVWVVLATHSKRLHDRDKSLWWLAAGLIPIAGLIWFIVELGILRGTPDRNRFGPDPTQTLRKIHVLLWKGIAYYVTLQVTIVLFVAGVVTMANANG